MFTGLIEEIGTVRHVVSGTKWGSIAICCMEVLTNTKIGDSIAVNGVFLTVTSLQKDGFTADVMAETLRRSNLGNLCPGISVNLERAMAADGRFGGHMVAGHVDGTGALIQKKREGNAVLLTIAAAPSLLYEVVEKGSIAIDGVSLTVISVANETFTVSIIPIRAQKPFCLIKKSVIWSIWKRISLPNTFAALHHPQKKKKTAN